jgi:Negative regulator of replication initiationR
MESAMSPRIDVDDAVFGYLQSKAIAFVETPNDTLRRLFDLDTTAAPAVKSTTSGEGRLGRKPKASLGRMIRAGLLANGQKLFLRDYQGRPVPDGTAYIGGDGIFSSPDRKRLYSMSDLAQELLKKQGYQSDSVRGPSHWHTEDGRSITEIWDDFISKSQP